MVCPGVCKVTPPGPQISRSGRFQAGTSWPEPPPMFMMSGSDGITLDLTGRRSFWSSCAIVSLLELHNARYERTQADSVATPGIDVQDEERNAHPTTGVLMPPAGVSRRAWRGLLARRAPSGQGFRASTCRCDSLTSLFSSVR